MNEKPVLKSFGNTYFNKSIAVWDNTFNDHLNYYNANLCDLVELDVNFEGVKQNDTVCQNNVLLLSSLKINTTITISTVYGNGEIVLKNLKNIKCKIKLCSIDIIIEDFNEDYKYSNVTLYPMIDNNYYTDEKVIMFCSTNNIKVVEQKRN